MKNTGKPAKSMVQQVTIDSSHSGQRLDNFLLGRLKGVPRSLVYRLVRRGQVRINKGRKRPDYRLQTGDVVRIPPLHSAQRAVPTRTRHDNAWLEDLIVFEDEFLLAIDKPSGMAVHGGSGIQLGIIETLRQLRPQNPFLELVHRLDRETSGCLLLAKKRSALTNLHAQLREQRTDKRYLALLMGQWQGKARWVDGALQKNQNRSGERMVRVSPAGSPARSQFIPKKNYHAATLVEVQLKTGRTHQARVHAAYIDHAIAGDEKYGNSEFNQTMRAVGLRRLFLHASSLGFLHPQTGKKIRLDARLPDTLQQVLDNIV